VKRQNFKPNPNLSNAVLAAVVVISMVGLLGFAYIDVTSRPAFLDVAKITIAAYLGYLIPNGR
jgi:hypothetical protein